MRGNICGAGAVIKMPNGSYYHLSMGCGPGTNTKGELLALWCLLTFAFRKNINFMHVARGSKIIIDWLNNKRKLQVLNLDSGIQRV